MVEINFAKIEKKWQGAWEKAKTFEANEKSKKPKYYVLEMFAYPSGEGLHIGHAFNFVIGDILARFKIMEGFNVLHPVGYDSLGLPAENAAIKVGTHPRDYTNKSIPNFMKQQKGLGLTYDWSRLINTADSSYYKWDQWIFLKMFEKGLAYQKTSAVNWCPSCKTVLANEQAQTGRCDRCDTPVEIKHLKQWFLKITDYADELYEGIAKLDWPDKTKAMQRNWIGKSHGTEIDFEINGEKWPIFTTRPDTLLGVTFMVVAAQHPKLDELVTKEQKKEVDKFLKKVKSVSEKDVRDLEKEGVFTGSYAVNPANGEKVPVYVGNFVVADYGAGMVMAVPAHDQRDFEFAKKYKIEIVRVVTPTKPIRSYLMGAEKISDEDLDELKINIIRKTKEGDREIVIPEKSIKDYEKLIEKKLTRGFWNEYIGQEIVFMFKHKDNKIERIVLSKDTGEKIDKLAAKFIGEKWNKSNVWKWLAENSFYTDLIVHTSAGKLVNSGEFNSLNNEEAKKKITDWLVKKKLGRRIINFKLRDWGISRQRYWGTPIPIIHCEKCGAVPVPEKDLPIELPKDIKFGDGNPLETNEKWLNVKCPKCGGEGRRESDTMDTFVNSSWYFMRYCDPKNDKKIFDPKKVDYWCPIDSYIGGAEHACMHLIYSRFYTKFLADIGLIKFREPAKRLFHQGMINDEGGEKMSKSKGNVVEPLKTMAKYGVDTTRLFLVSVAAPDKGFDWTDKGIQGSLRFIKRIVAYFDRIKFSKDSMEVLSKLNKTIKNVGEDYENFVYRKATIELRELFDLIEKNGASKETLEKFLKILNPICPHITEELWAKLGNKDFISTSEWPKAEKVKTKKVGTEDLNSKIIERIKEIVKENTEKVYVYVMPFELDKVDSGKIGKVLGRDVGVYSVSDKDKHDPENKAKKAKPGKAAIYLE